MIFNRITSAEVPLRRRQAESDWRQTPTKPMSWVWRAIAFFWLVFMRHRTLSTPRKIVFVDRSTRLDALIGITPFSLFYPKSGNVTISTPTSNWGYSEPIFSLLLLYDTKAMTATVTRKAKASIKSYLRRIIGVFWPDTIINIELAGRAGQIPVDMLFTRRKRQWIGHALSKGHYTNAWNPLSQVKEEFKFFQKLWEELN